MSWLSDFISDIEEAILGKVISFPEKKKREPPPVVAPEPRFAGGAEDATSRAINQWLLRRKGRRATELTRGFDLGVPALGVPTLLGV